MSWLSDTLANLRRNVPFGTMVFNFKRFGWKVWLHNELAPAGYTNGFKVPAPTKKQLITEAIGWGKHIVIAYAVLFVLNLFTQITPFQGYMIALGGSFAFEVFQFFRDRALFINPVNSIIDIFFYLVGVFIYFL